MDENQKQNLNSKEPDWEGEQLAQLLARFSPRPSQRFYRRMEAAPWNAGSLARNRPRFLVAAAGLLLLIFAFGLASPSLQASAQRWLRFFQASPTESLDLVFTMPYPPDTSSSYHQRDFRLSAAEVEALAGYPIRMFSALPEGFQFAGAHYAPQLEGVTLKYTRNGQAILFYQRPLQNIQEYSRIGPTAQVKKVQVRGVEGELVQGGWRISSNSQPMETSPPGTPVHLEIFWDDKFSQLTLRWQEDEMAYEVSGTAQNEIDSDFLIHLANTIE
jgi:hypothetical protein